MILIQYYLSVNLEEWQNEKERTKFGYYTCSLLLLSNIYSYIQYKEISEVQSFLYELKKIRILRLDN